VAPAPAQRAEPTAVSPLAAVRLLLKETRRGGVAAELGRIATQLGRSPDELLATLTGAGLQVPAKAREKPVFAEHAGEIFWLNRNARGELWLNAKPSKFSGGAGDAGASRKTARRAPDRKAEAD
jgi:hypothetical protein